MVKLLVWISFLFCPRFVWWAVFNLHASKLLFPQNIVQNATFFKKKYCSFFIINIHVSWLVNLGLRYVPNANWQELLFCQKNNILRHVICKIYVKNMGSKLLSSKCWRFFNDFHSLHFHLRHALFSAFCASISNNKNTKIEN